jgi:hypothetical protein
MPWKSARLEEGEARRLRGGKVACARRGQLIHASAPACPSCKSSVEEPRAIGFLRDPKDSPANIPSLPYRMVAVKRCPVCATRFDRRVAKQTCGRRLIDDA